MSSDASQPSRRLPPGRLSLPPTRDPLSREATIQLLPRFKQQLRIAEHRAQRAMGDVEALRQIVEGLEALAGTSARQAPLFVEGASPPTKTLAADVPLGQEAVRKVMLTNPERDWPQAVITREILNRGWINPEAKVPQAAVRAATQRLAAAGLAEKVAPGRYRLTESGREEGDG
jgi:hypothetical protein